MIEPSRSELVSAAYNPVFSALRPSEYTAALIQGLRVRRDWVCQKAALEIGPGSGVVLAAIAEMGAASLCGVDIEAVAVEASSELLRRLDYGGKVDIFRGDMWAPVEGRRFDIIAANLPQFPMEPVHYAERLPTWSSGGSNGRRLVDRFIGCLAEHLSPGGRAIITHNGFIGLNETRAALARHSLSSDVVATILVSLPAEKLALITPDVLRAEEGRSIHHFGPYAFAEMHLVEIFAAARPG